jgi:ABC-type branched-subunit amino acid transport system substrate-binding protein
VVHHPLDGEQQAFLRLDNIPSDRMPIRVGVLLPFSNGSPATRALATGMMKAAALAMFDARNPDVLLMSQDEGSTPAASAEAARTLLDKGAEVIVGPLFAQAAEAVGPVARDRGVPVISFSTDRNVAGNGVFLLSFLPEGEVHRVLAYASSQGHSRFAAMVPQNLYGDRVSEYFRQSVAELGGQAVDVEKFATAHESVAAPAAAVAHAAPDTILIAQGGPLLREIVTSLVATGMKPGQAQLVGTGLWDDSGTIHDPLLAGGLFAAPPPRVEDEFVSHYHATYGINPPHLAALAYDAVSLITLLSNGTPYARFTPQTLTDANGFNGVDGIFRFHSDGTSERGLAVLAIEPGGTLRVASPAPRSFQNESAQVPRM